MVRWVWRVLALSLLLLAVACSSQVDAVPQESPTMAPTVPAPTITLAPTGTPLATTAVRATPALVTPAGTPAFRMASPATPAVGASSPTAAVVAQPPSTLPVPTSAPPPPGRVARPAPGSGVVQDENGLCQVTLPAGLTQKLPNSSEFSPADGQGLGFVAATPLTGTIPLEAAAQGFIRGFTSVTTNYMPTSTTATADTVRVDFTATLVQPGQGTFYFKQFGSTLCAVTLFVYRDSTLRVAPVTTALLDSLQVVQP